MLLKGGGDCNASLNFIALGVEFSLSHFFLKRFLFIILLLCSTASITIAIHSVSIFSS